MKKKTLSIAYDYDFELWAISTIKPAHKIAWEINRALTVRLTRQDDLVIEQKSKRTSYHAHFSYETPVTLLKLLKNKGREDEIRHLIAPEVSHADYILYVRNSDGLLNNRLRELLSNIPSIEILTFIPLPTLKSRNNFIFN